MSTHLAPCRCLFAYTATHQRAYPEYLNVSVKPDGGLVVIVRAPPTEAGYEGATLSVELPADERAKLLTALEQAQ